MIGDYWLIKSKGGRAANGGYAVLTFDTQTKHPRAPSMHLGGFLALVCSYLRTAVSLSFMPSNFGITENTGGIGQLPHTSTPSNSVNSNDGGASDTESQENSYSGPWAYSPNSSFSSVESAEIVSSCVCGRLKVQTPVGCLHESTPSVDCFCRSCRKYHSAAVSSFLVADRSQVEIKGDTAQTYRDICFELGIVERIFCRFCFSKMATQTKAGTAYKDQILVNMGPVEDSTIPTNMLESLRHGRRRWQEGQKSSWLEAVPQAPEADTELPANGRWTGGCSCGASRFYIDYHPPTELQHCYCRLCRQLSGGAFATWIPFQNEDIQWNGEPPLLRTTPMGQRHICRQCGGVLSIVYDDQPGCTWPSVGSFDDANQALGISTTFPASTAAMNHHLYRICHICTDFLQRWYRIPDDGLERIDGAS